MERLARLKVGGSPELLIDHAGPPWCGGNSGLCAVGSITGRRQPVSDFCLGLRGSPRNGRAVQLYFLLVGERLGAVRHCLPTQPPCQPETIRSGRDSINVFLPY